MAEAPTATDYVEGGVDLTVILPAYNEEGVVASVIQEVRAALGPWEGTWEIVVVDDASTDKTAELAEATGVRVIRRIQNGGSGAARKTGIRHARGAIIAMLDVDGTYRPADLISMLTFCPPYDMVNGARNHEQGTYKPLRTVVKWLVRKLAEWISDKRIPDLNTGMKLFKRDVMCRYMWAIPDGFSCVSSMTLAMLCNGHAVHYVAVGYRPRGRSEI